MLVKFSFVSLFLLIFFHRLLEYTYLYKKALQLKTTVSKIKRTQSSVTTLALTQSKHAKMSHLKVIYVTSHDDLSVNAIG